MEDLHAQSMVKHWISLAITVRQSKHQKSHYLDKGTVSDFAFQPSDWPYGLLCNFHDFSDNFMVPTFFPNGSIMPLGQWESKETLFSIQRAQIISQQWPISVTFPALVEEFILCYAVQDILCYAVRPFSSCLTVPVDSRSYIIAGNGPQGMSGQFQVH